MNSARLGALAHEKHGWQAEAGTPAGAEETDLDPDELSALSGTVGKRGRIRSFCKDAVSTDVDVSAFDTSIAVH